LRARGCAEPLFVWGALPELEIVALVGTRAASTTSVDFARALGFELATAGYGVISGGAIGVDTGAHLGALQAGGATIAVLGSGFDHLYPPRNAPLFGRIAAEGGAVVSAYPPQTPPRRYNFPRRNKLIAAWARVVVVIEAPSRSGALITAALARRMEIPVLCRDAGAGARRLLRSGAGLVERADDVLRVLAGDRPRTRHEIPEDPDQRDLLALLLEKKVVSVDEAVDRLGWTPSRAAAALIRLELAGLASSLPAGGFTLDGKNRDSIEAGLSARIRGE
jgi:DNA processing protein